MVTWLRYAVRAVLLSAALAAPATAQTAPPPESEVARLIWSTLIALDHANRTGNYTVLRDLSAPGFRDANDAARLAGVFARTRDLPLGQAVLYAPQLSAAPGIGEDGLLRLNGRIPMRPDAVLFEMLFAQAGTEWRLFGLSVGRGGRAPDDESEARE
ncbi:MAG: hypothetical protein U5K36_09975 [Roseovarius sp.]|nr:hypothetical protein [Roseovarius sp.]